MSNFNNQNVQKRFLVSTDFQSGDIVEGAHFLDVSLDHCVLQGVTFRGCTFTQCGFGYANIHDVTFKKCSFYDCTINAACVVDTTFNGCEIDSTEFLSMHSMYEVIFKDTSLERVTFANRKNAKGDIVFKECKILYCDFEEFSLDSSVWEEVSVRATSFKKCPFDAAILNKVIFSWTTFSGCGFINSGYSNVELISSSYDKCSFDNACTFDNVNLRDTVMSGDTIIPSHATRVIKISPTIGRIETIKPIIGDHSIVLAPKTKSSTVKTQPIALPPASSPWPACCKKKQDAHLNKAFRFTTLGA